MNKLSYNPKASLSLNTHKLASSIIGYLVSIVSIFLGIIIYFFQNEKGIYEYIYIIPLLYGFLNTIFLKIYFRKSLFKYILLILMFTRYVIAPFILLFEGFPENLYYIVYSQEIILKASFLMGFEMVCIFYVIWFMDRKLIKGMEFSGNNIQSFNFKNGKNFGEINILLLLIIIITFTLFTIYPGLFHFYHFIFDGSIQQTMNLNEENLSSSVPNGLHWIGFTLGELTRYIIVIYLIAVFYKKFEKNPLNIYVYLALLVVIINALIATSRQMAGLIMTLVIITQIVKMFPTKKKLLIRLSAIFTTIILITLIISYFTASLTYSTLSNITESYTGGFYEVYQSVKSFEIVNLDFFDRLKLLIIDDTLSYINIISSLIYDAGRYTSSLIYNYYLYGSGFTGGKIVPMVSQGYLFFGLFFSPIFTVICIYLMFAIEKKIINAKGNYICNMYMGIIFAVAPIMYNYSIVLVLLTTMVLPVYIASLLNRVKVRY